jgi:threonylcarbamoyladenosine tRNA methylthiotransferase MtaB
MEFSKELGFSKIHVFPYSARRGTPAASMKQISPDIKKDRVKRLIELSDKLEEEYYKLFIGKETDVIFEQAYQNNLVGHSSNYLEISANLSKDYIKKHCIVKIIKYENKKLISELIKVLN